MTQGKHPGQFLAPGWCSVNIHSLLFTHCLLASFGLANTVPERRAKGEGRVRRTSALGQVRKWSLKKEVSDKAGREEAGGKR